jgi:mRNA-degrading endonuclease RelE of RelBE toxin-antitoxin system
VYSVHWTDDGLADVRSLPKNVRNFLKKEITGRLTVQPYECSKPLRQPLQLLRSFRCREYRVVFRANEEMRAIVIAAVGKRLPQSQTDVYRRLEASALQGKLSEKLLSALRGLEE